MKNIGLAIALVLSVRVSPQEANINYNNMTTVVIMQNGKKIRCHETKVNYDGTTDIIIYNSWGRKMKKAKSAEIKNLLHIKDMQ